ncbi:uncharacterized protein [Aegilops tauschii subsp. strangulata]|uniref:uncharacterized protein n=1 Tax=Aegilops tauschii subsp. strangulata TaxID=200361 RepID=UPI00098B2235|nr:uncharacterized protein LOC109754209 [Aegilops tauschii subsp. strangulata]
MLIVCASHPAPSVHSEFLSGWLSLNSSRMPYHLSSTGRNFRKQNRHQLAITFAKSSSLEDLVASVKPSRLLPTVEPKTFPNSVPDEILSKLILEESDAFYILELCTSRELSSSLLDKNSAILICLIDVDSDSLLERVPAIYGDQPSHGTKASQFLPFQSGAVDIITFKGPKLQTIKEIWIGLESGSWRLDGLSLKVIHGALNTPKDLEGTLELKFSGLQFTFDKLGVLLAEDGASVVEARPTAVTDLSGISISDLQEGQLSSAKTTSSIKELKEDGLREYADLKQSLLLYDISIVITGFSAFTLASNDGAAYSFLVGGIGGLLYLLLLQRSVDGLPAISSPSEASSSEPTMNFSGVRRPWLILSIVMVAGAVALKYGAGGDNFELTPTELFVGTAGFLANKVAVLLAAFKPLQSNLESDDGSVD